MSTKVYSIGTYTRAQFRELRDSLTADASRKPTSRTAQEPIRKVKKKREITYSGTRGEFELTEAEATTLKADPRIVFIHESIRDENVILGQTGSWEQTPEQRASQSISVLDGTTNTPKNRYNAPINHYQRVFHGNYRSDKTYSTLLQRIPADGIQGDKRELYAPNSSSFVNLSGPSNNQATYQLIRPTQKRNLWIQLNKDFSEPINARQMQRGAGEDVDIIIVDSGVWAGHTEFLNSGVDNAVNPKDYIGGNLFRDTTIYSGSGYSDVLDIVLDGPYYLDPEFFNADPDNRLETRWDGTIVPVPEVAVNWWGKGYDAGELIPMNTATGRRSTNFPFSASLTRGQRLGFYRRPYCHGSQKVPEGGNATHGTPCAALAYGRTQGWAYNANKWSINAFGERAVDQYGGGFTISTTTLAFDMLRIFHRYKPKNPKFGTKNPTIISNSWSKKMTRQTPLRTNVLNPDTSASFIRYQNIVSGGIDLTTVSSSQNTVPIPFMSINFNFCPEFLPNEMTMAGNELIQEYIDTDGNTQPGPIVLASANGNQAQHIFGPESPNYDNRYCLNEQTALSDNPYEDLFGIQEGTHILEVIPLINRRGFPANMGVNQNGVYNILTSHSMQNIEYPVLTVGALDNELHTGSFNPAIANYPLTGAFPPFNGLSTPSGLRHNPGTPKLGDFGFYNTGEFVKERVTDYSGKGPGVDFYMPADATLAAACVDMTKVHFDVITSEENIQNYNTGRDYIGKIDLIVSRSDHSYASSVTQSFNKYFDGTSAATPVGAGWLATVVQYNRGWSYRDVRAYLTGSAYSQSGADFYTGSVAPSISSSLWQDPHSLQGGSPIVGYTAPFVATTPFPLTTINQHLFSGSFVQSGSAAQFKNGISITGSLNGTFIGDGSGLINVPSTATSASLFFGSESLSSPPTYGEWITGSGGVHTITLSTSASNAVFNHFTFLRTNPNAANNWEERSDYIGTQKGLVNQNSLTETLDTGVYRYLLLAMSTASKQTLVKSTVVIINP